MKFISVFMNTKTRSYVTILMEILSNIIINEPEIIKRKAELFLDPVEKNSELILIIEKQKKDLVDFIRHVHNFEEHKKLILHEVFDDLKLEGNEKSKFEEFLVREDNLFLFFLNHMPTYLKIFDEQILSLKKISKLHSIFLKLESKIQKRDPNLNFLEILKKEEIQFYQLLYLFKKHLDTLSEHRQQLQFFENYEKITQNIGKVAMIITMIPLGPLEILSGPFWIIYFGGKKMEKHFKYYEDYKKTQETQIVNYELALSNNLLHKV